MNMVEDVFETIVELAGRLRLFVETDTKLSSIAQTEFGHYILSRAVDLAIDIGPAKGIEAMHADEELRRMVSVY